METWIIFILGLILGVPLSIFANYATPSVISYFKNRSLSSRERKILLIRDRYWDVKLMHREHKFFNATMFRFLAWEIALFAIIVIISFSIFLILIIIQPENNLRIFKDPVFLVGVGVVVALINLFLFVLKGMVEYINQFVSFSSFRNWAIDEIKKLGGNPEELDKIDKEIEEVK